MAQSIIDKNLFTLREEFDSKILSQANEYFLKKRFDLGEYPETVHTTKVLNILYIENCDNLENIELYYLDKEKKLQKCDCECEEPQEPCIPCKQTIMTL